jgi:regulation of enolase protein 1 (concanavalin A-like superfamily)
MSQGVAAFFSIVPRLFSWLGVPFLSRLCGILAVSLWTCSLARGAESVTLAWNPSSSAGVIGYRIYYGTASGSYSSSQDAGNATTATICCLEPSRVYYFAARAYLSNGELSSYSEEVSFRTQQGENTPPYFDELSDTSITTDGTQRNIPITGIQSGVSDENQPLTVTASSSRPDLVPNPAVTYTSPNSAGAFLIAPIPYAEGIVTITVTVNDGQSINNKLSRSFELSLRSPNSAPTLAPIGDVSITSDGTQRDLSLAGIQAGAAGESQPLTLTARSSRPDLVPNPTVSYSSPASTANLRILPVVGSSGTATITVTVDDGQAGNNTFSRTFNVTVTKLANTPPTFSPIGDTSITSDGTQRDLSVTGIQAGAAGESQPLTLTAQSSRPDLVPNPTVSYSSPASTANLRILPVVGSSGTATITVTVNDGQASNNTFSRTFNVTVAKPANTPPTFSPIGDTSITSDGTHRDLSVTGIQAGAAGESQPLTLTAQSSRPDLVPHPSVSYSSPASTANLRILPVVGSSGTATITVTVNDGQASNNTFSRTFNVTVAKLGNTPPTFSPIGDISMTADGTPRDVPVTGILAGSAGESQPLTLTAQSSRPDLVPNPTVSYSSPQSSGSLRVTTVAGSSGTATITVTVNDGQAVNPTFTRTFSVTVGQEPNTPPTFSPMGDISMKSDGTQRDVPVTGILAGAAGESQPLTITARSSRPDLVPNPTVFYTSPESTAILRIAPVPGTNGVATITLTVYDGGTENHTFTRTFNVTVTKPANTPPIFSPIGEISMMTDGTARDVQITGILPGAGGEIQTLTLKAQSNRPDLLPNPTVLYTSPESTAIVRLQPVDNVTGVATILITADDGQATNSTFSRSFRVTLSVANLPPTLDAIADLTLPEDSSPRIIALTGINAGSAQETQPLTVRATSSLPSVLPDPVVSYRSPDSTATITLMPVANRSGVATITVTIGDGQVLNNQFSQTFKATVYPLNDPPQIDPVTDVTLFDNAEPITIPLTGIHSGATNEIQRLTITATSSSPSLLPDPQVTYTSPNSQGLLTLSSVPTKTGSATVTVKISDGQSLNSEMTRTFNVVVEPAGPSSHYFEAESAERVAPMETAAINSASRGLAAFSRIAEQGFLTFNVTIRETGAYYVWGRVLSIDSSSDSFYLRVDQTPEVVFHTTLRQWSDDWQWAQLEDWVQTAGGLQGTPRVLPLTKGTHQITVRAREHFSFLDALFLSTDPAAVPPPAQTPSILVSNVPHPMQVNTVGTTEDGCGVSLDSGEYTVTGLGTLGDDLATEDSFVFVNQALHGDGGITVRVTSTPSLGTNSFVGLMIREDVGSRAKYAAVGITQGEQLSWRTRSQSAAAPSRPELQNKGNIQWLHLRRSGDVITAYGSADWFSWTVIQSIELPLGTPVQIGIVVASGDAQSLHTTKFYDLNISYGF